MITMDTIIREGHPTLRETAKELTFPLSDQEKQLGKDMFEFLVNSQDPIKAEEATKTKTISSRHSTPRIPTRT